MKQSNLYYGKYANTKIDKTTSKILADEDKRSGEKETTLQSMSFQNGSPMNANINTIGVNALTKDMFQPELPVLISVPILDGFVLYNERDYVTNINFDTSRLSLYQADSNIGQLSYSGYQYLFLKGLISYNVNIGPFRPYVPEVLRGASSITSFGIGGVIPVSKVVQYTKVGGSLSYNYNMFWEQGDHYITAMDGSTYYRNSRRPYFYNIINNSKVIRTVQIPLILRFEPAVYFG